MATSGMALVTKILVHPIKSCRGTSLATANYSPEGLEYDRKWCIMDANTHTVITARDISKLVLICPRIELEPSSPHAGKLHIRFPEGSGCDEFSVPLQPSDDLLHNWQRLTDIHLWGQSLEGYICPVSCPTPTSTSPSSVLSKYCNGRSVHLVYKGSQPRLAKPTRDFPDLNATFWFQDGYPLLIISEESVEAIEAEMRALVGIQGIRERWQADKLEVERFRPNIVLRGAGAFAEDNWAEIVLQSAQHSQSEGRMSLVSKCTRCLLPNVDTKTGIRDPAVPYKVMLKSRIDKSINERSPCLGRNAVPSGCGKIEVGAIVHVMRNVDGK